MRAPYTQIYVHFVWATWDRMPYLLPSVEAPVYASVKAACLDLKCEAISVGGDLDHIHLLAQMSPIASVSELVRKVKGSSSHLMNHEIAPDEFFKWQGYYGAFSVSRSGVKRVQDYIERQKEHHADKQIFVEWERCYLEQDVI